MQDVAGRQTLSLNLKYLTSFSMFYWSWNASCTSCDPLLLDEKVQSLLLLQSIGSQQLEAIQDQADLASSFHVVLDLGTSPNDFGQV